MRLVEILLSSNPVFNVYLIRVRKLAAENRNNTKLSTTPIIYNNNKHEHNSARSTTLLLYSLTNFVFLRTRLAVMSITFRDLFTYTSHSLSFHSYKDTTTLYLHYISTASQHLAVKSPTCVLTKIAHHTIIKLLHISYQSTYLVHWFRQKDQVPDINRKVHTLHRDDPLVLATGDGMTAHLLRWIQTIYYNTQIGIQVNETLYNNIKPLQLIQDMPHPLTNRNDSSSDKIIDSDFWNEQTVEIIPDETPPPPQNKYKGQ